MIQKIKEFPNKSKNIYVNLITGQEGTIAEIGTSVTPSDRVNKRHPIIGTPKVRSNRKSKRGRNIYYQSVDLVIPSLTKPGNEPLLDELGHQKKKVIKHVQESYSAIQRKTSLLEFYDKVETNKSKWMEKHPEYKRKVS